jgi:hypothetical protein
MSIEEEGGDYKPTPRDYLLDLSGEAFANSRNREAKEVRKLASHHALTSFAEMAAYLSNFWSCVASAISEEVKREAEEEAGRQGRKSEQAAA